MFSFFERLEHCSWSSKNITNISTKVRMPCIFFLYMKCLCVCSLKGQLLLLSLQFTDPYFCSIDILFMIKTSMKYIE